MASKTESDQIFKVMGSRIKMRREELRLSQDDLAGKSGITKSYISNIENGKQNVTVEVLRVLAEHLKTSIAALISTNEETLSPHNVTPEDARRVFEVIFQQWEQDRNRTGSNAKDVPADVLKMMKLLSGGPNAAIDWQLIRSILAGILASKTAIAK
jgi:transcriptional regulator with XRE-family HTH domain